MNLSIPEDWLGYWTPAELFTNFTLFLNMLGALLLGLIVGYERSYRGRAAGMRTYGLVCMASCALIVVVGYPGDWFGGRFSDVSAAGQNGDPTRVIQGIATGVGFLGTGVIMKEGLHISGLTTAASIWAVSVIGILVGLGFYSAAMLLALMSAAAMLWGSKIENWLPSHTAVGVQLRFRPGYAPTLAGLAARLEEKGYALAEGSFDIQFQEGQLEWRFVAVERKTLTRQPLTELAQHLSTVEGVENFHLTYARN